MNYEKEYKFDKKIAEKIFNRHFWNFKQYKEDMIQVAVMRIWMAKQKHYTALPLTWMFKVARRAMVDFIRPHAKYLDDVSLSEEVDLGEELCMLEEILGEDDEQHYCAMRCENLNNFVENKANRLVGKEKEIINMYLNRRSYAEIARAFGTTKQNIGKYVAKFRKSVNRGFDRNREVA